MTPRDSPARTAHGPTRRPRLVDSALRFARASATNQLARFAPSFYVRLTGQTGRGDSSVETAADMAAYFRRCFDEYFDVLGVSQTAVDAWLDGKVLLEYGPGDVPGVALLMIAHGAHKVYCADRFPMLALREKNVEAIRQILGALSPEQRRRADDCFVSRGDPRSGFAARRIEYLVRESGLSGLSGAVDVVVSRAVLEHVNDLEGTFRDMERAMKAGALAVHQVDLKSHGLHRDNPLDFLSWPAWMWTCMFSNKGAPNRWRVDRYRKVLGDTTLRVRRLTPTLLADPRDIADARPGLARSFAGLSDDDLACLGFWLVCEKPVR